MKILITNDDGIRAEALPHLIRFARRFGEVTCVAPKTEQSAKSQAIDFTRPVEVKQVEIAPDVTVWSMDSTPADCVRFGVLGLHETYDLLLSGINRGYNLGDDIAYSGTVGAILEGARLHLPGIALSTDSTTLPEALTALPQVLDYFKAHDLLARHSHYNINFPPKPRGIRLTRQGEMYFSDGFERVGDDHYIQVGAPVQYDRSDLGIDIDAIRAGFISITPITAQKTAFGALEALRDQGL